MNGLTFNQISTTKNNTIKKLLLLFTALLLISCSSDDDGQDGIIGKWQLTQYDQVGPPCVVSESSYCPSVIDGEFWWIFKDDGQYSNNLIRRSSVDFVNYNHYGTWRRSGTSSKIRPFLNKNLFKFLSLTLVCSLLNILFKFLS